MGTTVEKKKQTWSEALEEYMPKFQLAVPSKDIDARYIVASFHNAAVRNPALKECTLSSVVLTILQACELGLSLAPGLGHAYPVPFRNTDKKVKECTLIVGYKGFSYMMQDEKYGKKVKNIRAVSVYENEPFEVVNGRISHKQLPPGKRGTARKAVIVYLLLMDDTEVTHFMWMEDILKHRDRSRAKDSGPWKTDPEIMEQKTVLRDKVKWMGLGAAITKAATIDEYNEVGISAGEFVLEDEPQQSIEDSVKPGTEGKQEEKQQETKTEPAQKEEQKTEPAREPDEILKPEEQEKSNDKDANKVTGKQIGKINALFSNIGTKEEDRRAVISTDILKLAGTIASMKDLTKEQASSIIKWLEAREAEMSK